mmetsp:Transcript_164616/g.528076  ORF Transcript_164616/g.528076 Transcript_164616/m.528076 type:complete len:608 (-) Transcript_164616:269-2092(-)
MLAWASSCLSLSLFTLPLFFFAWAICRAVLPSTAGVHEIRVVPGTPLAGVEAVETLGTKAQPSHSLALPTVAFGSAVQDTPPDASTLASVHVPEMLKPTLPGASRIEVSARSEAVVAQTSGRNSHTSTSALPMAPATSSAGRVRSTIKHVATVRNKFKDNEKGNTAKDSCTPLPVPPDYDHGLFIGANLSYGIGGEPMEPPSPLGDYRGVSSLLHKLVAGNRGKVLVFGGSMTEGGGCSQPAARGGKVVLERACAWPARLGQWLRAAFPKATVTMQSLAQKGITTYVLFAQLGLLLERHGDADVVIIDTLVNDAWALEDRSPNWVSMVFEAFIRTVRDILPSAEIFVLLAGCSGCGRQWSAQHRIAMHYDLPTLDMFSMRGMTNFWNRWGGGVHPKWPVHAMIADTLAYVWGNSWESSCSKGHSGPTPLGKTFWPVAELAELTTCKKPLTVYSARNVSTAKPQMTAGDFRLYEDRAGKPGWIASQPGSCMKFPLTFGQDPRFAVTYLKSYLNISNVQVKLRKATYTLKGHWPTGDSRQVSLYSTKWFKVHKSELGSRTAKFAKLKTLADFTFMSGVEPNSELTVELCLSPVSDQSEQKVKVVQVVSC